MSALQIPFIRGRFLIPMVSHAVFFAAIALNLLDRNILMPAYMLVTLGLLLGLNVVEGSRLGLFLKRWYPIECERLFREKHVLSAADEVITEAYRRNSHWNLWLAGLWLALASYPKDDPILKRIRQHKRWVWIEAFSTLPVMSVVLELASSVSKALRAG
jgi:hypothetical protein